MTELLERALATARDLPPERQDEIARLVLALAQPDRVPYSFTLEESAAEDAADDEEASGAYSTDEELGAVWAKYGL